MKVTTSRRIIVGISGASGFQYGVKRWSFYGAGSRSPSGRDKRGGKTCELETDYQLDEVMALADVVHPIGNLGASISSGSFKTLGMLVAPVQCDPGLHRPLSDR
jgi:4-hydroxy-3-polyprenylbenzoate decarboxylase